MLSLLPSHIPALTALLADLGHPSHAQIAAALGVTVRTVQRWTSSDEAPRVALLALFWLTRWGQSMVECQAVNDARLQAQRAAVLERQNVALQVELQRLLRVGDFGCANDASQAAPAAVQAVRASRTGPRSSS